MIQNIAMLPVKPDVTEEHMRADGAVPRLWRVDPDRSSVTFSARGFWGLVPVTGSFAAPTGDAIVDQHGILAGELVTPVATLSTGLALRDRHLRGHAFFDVERYPKITFTVDRLNGSRSGHVVSGALEVRDRTVRLDLPVQVVKRGADELVLAARAVIEREPLGLGHSTLGMIQGPAEVGVDLVLTQPGTKAGLSLDITSEVM